MSLTNDQRLDYISEWLEGVGLPWVGKRQDALEGSPLYADDRGGYPVSIVSRFSIVTAVDHLAFVRDHWADKNSPIRHYGPFSALRGSLLGACHALWVLEPKSRSLRRHRALQFGRQNLHEWGNLLQDYGEAGHLDQEQSAAVSKQVEDLEAEREKIRALADVLPHGELGRINDTKLIKEVVESILGRGDADPFLTMGIRTLWRTGSAAAHGYPWRLLWSSDPRRIDYDQLHMAMHGAALLTTEALDLFNQRNSKH